MRKKIRLCVFLLVCLSSCGPKPGPDTPRADRNAEATHRVDLQPYGHGTAIVLDRSGFLLTCYHVVKQGERSPYVRISVDGGEAVDYPARVIAWDRELDLAVIKVDRRFEDAVVLGSSEDVHLLDAVYTIGFPYDLGEMAGYGRVKNAHWFDEEREIDGDLAIEFTDGQGMSGSGVFLARNGKMVGLLHAMSFAVDGENNITDNRQALIRVAIPINKIRTFLDRAGVPYSAGF